MNQGNWRTCNLLWIKEIKWAWEEWEELCHWWVGSRDDHAYTEDVEALLTCEKVHLIINHGLA